MKLEEMARVENLSADEQQLFEKAKVALDELCYSTSTNFEIVAVFYVGHRTFDFKLQDKQTKRSRFIILIPTKLEDLLLEEKVNPSILAQLERKVKNYCDSMSAVA